ncbi:MAG: sulfite exporter TauE/SafE family protein [Deltaproteobacteria bacterium]|nr:MAG: sulfite exporter TauE/SafE family protein [Deltaproteobacteria bacterium]
MIALVATLGLLGGVLSGLLGIGGGILMAPLLLYVPPLVGQPGLQMPVVAGLTIVQSLFASIAGGLFHYERGTMDVRLALWLGTTMLVTSFLGAWWSARLSADVLLVVFSVLATIAALLMLTPPASVNAGESAAGLVGFSRARAVLLGTLVGTSGGMVGQSGAFLVIPGMIHVLRVPVRVAIGTTLAVVLLAAIAGTAGKMATGQIVWPLAAALAVPAVVGAQVGARLSYRFSPSALRRILAAVISAAAVRLWIDVLAG